MCHTCGIVSASDESKGVPYRSTFFNCIPRPCVEGPAGSAIKRIADEAILSDFLLSSVGRIF